MIAQPYAKAAFDYAVEHKIVGVWHSFLQALSHLSEEPPLQRYLKSPLVEEEKVTTIFIEMLQNNLPAGGKNFLRLLAKNNRLLLLPAIAKAFKNLEAMREAKVDVSVHTAHELSPTQQEQLLSALEEKTKKQVTLDVTIEPNLIAGLMIRIGDQVIDGSLRGKLNQLAQSIS